jgi:hypothetical protein
LAVGRTSTPPVLATDIDAGPIDIATCSDRRRSAKEAAGAPRHLDGDDGAAPAVGAASAGSAGAPGRNQCG